MKAKENNRRQHATKGNTPPEEINIIQVNTGSGASRCSDGKLRFTINQVKAQVAIISESNIDVNDPSMLGSRARNFPGFVFVDKLLPGSSVARLSIFISLLRKPQSTNPCIHTPVIFHWL